MLNSLLQAILSSIPNPVFTMAELKVLHLGSDDALHSMIKRALAQEDIIAIRRGLYMLGPLFRPVRPDPLFIAEAVYGPSYVSLTTALSHHGWIPEAVRTVTSVTSRVPRVFDTPVGVFSYQRAHQRTLFAGVSMEGAAGGLSMMIARPLKALADYVETRQLDWSTCEPLLSSLRIERDQLAELVGADFDAIDHNYHHPRVGRFLAGIRKELGL